MEDPKAMSMRPIWLRAGLAMLAGAALWAIFRMYRNPEFIIGFSNIVFVCQ
jgi:hypothetical protein